MEIRADRYPLGDNRPRCEDIPPVRDQFLEEFPPVGPTPQL
jgi:hypothetical protein